MGNVDAISREFARQHSERLWKQLMLMPADGPATGARPRVELAVVVAVAALAALALTAGLAWLDDSAFARNVSLFVLPFLAGYFAWKRQVTRRIAAVLLVPFVLAAVVVNLYPFEPDGSTEVVAAIHVPIALWFAVGLAYVGGDWHPTAAEWISFGSPASGWSI